MLVSVLMPFRDAAATLEEAARSILVQRHEPLELIANAQKVDVVGYPDSKKVAASAGTFEKPIHRFIARQGESLDYWDGEPDAQ